MKPLFFRNGFSSLVYLQWKSRPSMANFYSSTSVANTPFSSSLETSPGDPSSAWIPKGIVHHTELRKLQFKVATAIGNAEEPPRIRETTLNVLENAEALLKPQRFSTARTMLDVLGPYKDLVVVFLLKNDDVDHPLLHFTNAVAADCLQHSKVPSQAQWMSLIVLLVSGMYGFTPGFGRSEGEVRERHDLVAKIAQVSWTTHQLHRKILDVSTLIPLLPYLYPEVNSLGKHTHISDWHRANKTATLIGDLLLTQKCSYLAALKSPKALELLCNSLAHFCESEFELRGDRVFGGFDAYLSRAELGLGSLLGHCLYTCLMFSGYKAQVCLEAFELGSKIGVLLQMHQDLEFLGRQEILDRPRWMDLGLLPVILKLRKEPRLYFKPHPEIFQVVKSDTENMAEAVGVFNAVQAHVLGHLATKVVVRNQRPYEVLTDLVSSLKPF